MLLSLCEVGGILTPSSCELLFQVEARAYEIWGGEEGLKEAHLKKAEMREKKLEKKYAKDIKGVCGRACMHACVCTALLCFSACS